MSRLDQAAFVGRAAELEAIGELFTDEPPASVVLVHGPGGIGKSALLREVARRGRQAGWTPVLVEGRDLPPVPDALEDALAAVESVERPLLLIDTYERMVALGSHLRRELLPALPDHSIVVVAGRHSPERGWFEGGWEAVTREIELAPLSREESETLLGAHGLAGGRLDELASWAGGSRSRSRWRPTPPPTAPGARTRRASRASSSGSSSGAWPRPSSTAATTTRWRWRASPG